MQSVYQTFGRLDGSPLDPTDISLVDVSINEFGDSTGASAALPYLAEARSVTWGIGGAAVERLGDESAAVAGLRVDGVYEASIYVRRGPFLARVAVLSPQGDPWNVALSVARSIAGRQAGNSSRIAEIGRTSGEAARLDIGSHDRVRYWAWSA